MVLKHKKIAAWIEEMAALTTPREIVYIDGSEEQLEALRKEGCTTGEIHKLNDKILPGCYFHRTAENDVARVEDRTFICSRKKEDAGATNNWMDPKEMYEKLGKLYQGSMKGRTMYVIPFIMGPKGSPFSKVGVELTDSIYVVLNMNIMTRIGNVAWEEVGEDGDFVKCLHAKKDVNPEERYIVQFPEDNTIWSINSAYGGNVLLGKKCFALRIASFLGKQEGWMAEHMLILGITNPKGEKKYVAAAFPSACGKTNLAMMIPPEPFKSQGYKVETVGDDIAWIRKGEDGRLWALNPEYGFFGVAPGTSEKTNPNALASAMKNAIFTNVLLRDEDNTVWWEGWGQAPESAIDWKGYRWTPDCGEKGAHPNSRFTAPATNCPCLSPEFENPQGVPLSAIIFGGRRAKTAPLVFEAFDWNHGVFVGATMASETTAAAAGAMGVVRRDPMAMLPFCGYNMGDYFQHWLDMGAKLDDDKKPKIFHVNWFRTDSEGHFMWPGFGDNLRVLNWIFDRCDGKVETETTPIGYVPKQGDINTEGLDITAEDMAEILKPDLAAYKEEIDGIKAFFEKIDGVGGRMPQELKDRLATLEKAL